MSRATTVTIDLDALRHNYNVLRQQAPASRTIAVVKADAYGHGLERAARALADADAFAVAALSEAERLRATGVTRPVLLLSGVDEPADLDVLRRLDITTVVQHPSQIEMLEQAAGSPVRCWIKIDSGMHRLGFPPADVHEIHARLAALPNVAGTIGLMTHFASSDELADSGGVNSTLTLKQLQVFNEATAGLPGPRSLANSAATLSWPQTHADWNRPGGALYGLSLVPGTCGADFGLRPVMRLATRLIAVNRFRAGDRIGYAASWTCPYDMPVGVAAVGYADGYPRAARAGTPVLVNGRRTQIIGRVSMDLATIDLSSQPDARPGDPVVLWGDGLAIEEVAACAGTISYEPTCKITRRVRVVEVGGE